MNPQQETARKVPAIDTHISREQFLKKLGDGELWALALSRARARPRFCVLCALALLSL